jgi:hypothetical protein
VLFALRGDHEADAHREIVRPVPSMLTSPVVAAARLRLLKSSGPALFEPSLKV